MPDRRQPRVRLESPSAARRAEFFAAVRRSRRLHASWTSAPWTPTMYRNYLWRVRQPAHVGYYAFPPHAGKGLMREGLSLVLDDAFRRRKLHRLEASIQPGNLASKRLVRRLGFRREGLSPRVARRRPAARGGLTA